VALKTQRWLASPPARWPATRFWSPVVLAGSARPPPSARPPTGARVGITGREIARTRAAAADLAAETQGRQGGHHPAGAAHGPGDRLAIGERSEGPVFLAADGRRLDRHGAGRMVRRVARCAGITKPVGPHTLQHAFITAALDAGVSLRDVQEAASHADPRTTMRYDRARGNLDRHATYIVAAYVAGAAR
jgi:integrase